MKKPDPLVVALAASVESILTTNRVANAGVDASQAISVEDIMSETWPGAPLTNAMRAEVIDKMSSVRKMLKEVFKRNVCLLSPAYYITYLPNGGPTDIGQGKRCLAGVGQARWAAGIYVYFPLVGYDDHIWSGATDRMADIGIGLWGAHTAQTAVMTPGEQALHAARAVAEAQRQLGIYAPPPPAIAAGKGKNKQP